MDYLETKTIFLNKKFLYFYLRFSNYIMSSVKLIICKTTHNTYIRQSCNNTYSFAKVDCRGAVAPKINFFLAKLED